MSSVLEIGLQGVAQVGLEPASGLNRDIHFCLEEAMGAAPFGLRSIKGGVGVAQELFSLDIFRNHADSDTGVDADGPAFHIVRFGDRCAEHAHLKVGQREFDVVYAAIQATLHQAGVPERELNEFMAVIESFRSMVVAPEYGGMAA
jgi:hypothetical protein